MPADAPRTPEEYRQRNDHDCLRCCVAYIFGLPYEDVPLFGGEEFKRWVANKQRGSESEGASWAQIRDIEAWLAKRGLGMIQLPDPSGLTEEARKRGYRLPWGYCIASGKSPRGDWDHAVVMIPKRDSDLPLHVAHMVHDPHPSDAGLRGPPHTYWCFTMNDPVLAYRVAYSSAIEAAAAECEAKGEFWLSIGGGGSTSQTAKKVADALARRIRALAAQPKGGVK